MKIKLVLINAALLFFLIGLFTTIGGDTQSGAVAVLVASIILLGNYLFQLRQSFRQSTIWTWQTLAYTGAVLLAAIIFMHGFSSSMGMMMVFRIKSFTTLYLVSGFLLPILFFYFSVKSSSDKDKGWVRIGVSIGALLCLTGLLGFTRIIPFPSQNILYSWVFVLFFYLIFLAKKYISTAEKAEKQEPLKLLIISFLFLGFWVLRFHVSSPLGSGYFTAIVHFGFVPLLILPLSILSIRKFYPYIVFLFYFVLLDLFFIQFDSNVNYLVKVGINACVGYEQATDYPINTDPGIPLSELMREPTNEELDEILLEWKEKDFSPKNMEVVHQEEMPNGDSIHIISHLVSGFKHYGAIRIPKNLNVAKAPILLVLEGGGTGVDISKLSRLTQGRCSDQTDKFISILPSYRGCILRGEDFCFRSEGYAGDPWLGPAEDAISFLEAVKIIYNKPDSTRVLGSGMSRGATVALIIGGLSETLDYIIATSTHTKFLDEYVVLNERVGNSYAQAFYTPAASPGQIRKRIIASSPYYFADKLPPFDLYQGRKDEQTTVWHATVLEERLREIRRDSGTYKLFIYDDKGHGYDDTQAVCQSLATFLEIGNRKESQK